MNDPLAWKAREEPEDPRMDWGPGEWHDETVRLKIENERLREALRPFTEAYAAIDHLHCPTFRGREALGYFDAAVAALSEERP